MSGKKYMQKKINSCKSGQKYILDIFYKTMSISI